MDKTPDKSQPLPDEFLYVTRNPEQEQRAVQKLISVQEHLDANDVVNAAMAAYLAYHFSVISGIKESAFNTWSRIVKNARRDDIEAHLTDILKTEPEDSIFWNKALEVRWYGGCYSFPTRNLVM